jgi:transcriptional regulator with XRE-family HTH domain
MTVGECIKSLRAAAGLKQHELASRAGISASMLSLVESGKRDATIPMLRAIAGALHVPANVLFAAALDSGAPANSTEAHQARQLTERLMRVAHRLVLAERFRDEAPGSIATSPVDTDEA